jgi:putative membrane protein
MHSHSIGNGFCGSEGLFGFHFGGFFSLFFWVACLMLLLTIFRALFSKNQQTSSALSILEERYASGEIDQEEFIQKKKNLK